ncbi:Uncharacterized protein APZ42_021319 [Daphnia magna]|uniref:Uncharacterized protein n=1 Tax=Daphnia magna TaxID=35525 RepID=A0A164WSG9_9CRUS|nr:Uncharacterized protein APZ42_021319 [Daphnia magna]
MVTRTYWVVCDTHHVMCSNKEKKPSLLLLSFFFSFFFFFFLFGWVPSWFRPAIPEKNTYGHLS